MSSASVQWLQGGVGGAVGGWVIGVVQWMVGVIWVVQMPWRWREMSRLNYADALTSSFSAQLPLTFNGSASHY